MSIQKEVEAYLAEQPLILEALEEGLINYSALVRKIVNESRLQQSDFDAILVSIRRFRDRTRRQTKTRRSIRQLLQGSTIELQNRRAVVILDVDAPLRLLTRTIERIERERERVSLIQSAHAVTIILHERFLPLLAPLRAFERKRTADLVALTIHSPEQLESVPGVIAHLTRLLAGKEINVVEMASCYTDTLFIIEKRDVEKAMAVLGL